MTIVKRKHIWYYSALLLLLLTTVYGYTYFPYKVQFIGHYDKIWAHRVNSKEKLKSAVKYFKGVELDLVYDSQNNILDVTHPPVKSIGLELEDYISQLDDNQFPYLWLDIKNLDFQNCDSVFKKLKNIFESKGYPSHKILIETRYPDALRKFSEYGFIVSYYLPSGLYLKNKGELTSEIAKIQKILNENPALGISTDYHDYDILKTNFPNRKKYIWILVSSFSTDFSTIRKILNDSNVEVVLVNYQALRGNR